MRATAPSCMSGRKSDMGDLAAQHRDLRSSRDAQWAWETAGHAAMCIIEGYPLWDELRADRAFAHEASLDPSHCIDEAGAAALRLAGIEAFFRVRQAGRRRLRRILTALGEDEHEADRLMRLKEGVAEKRLRENWAGVCAIARLLLAHSNPSAQHVRLVFLGEVGR